MVFSCLLRFFKCGWFSSGLLLLGLAVFRLALGFHGQANIHSFRGGGEFPPTHSILEYTLDGQQQWPDEHSELSGELNQLKSGQTFWWMDQPGHEDGPVISELSLMMQGGGLTIAKVLGFLAPSLFNDRPLRLTVAENPFWLTLEGRVDFNRSFFFAPDGQHWPFSLKKLKAANEAVNLDLSWPGDITIWEFIATSPSRDSEPSSPWQSEQQQETVSTLPGGAGGGGDNHRFDFRPGRGGGGGSQEFDVLVVPSLTFTHRVDNNRRVLSLSRAEGFPVQILDSDGNRVQLLELSEPLRQALSAMFNEDVQHLPGHGQIKIQSPDAASLAPEDIDRLVDNLLTEVFRGGACSVPGIISCQDNGGRSSSEKTFARSGSQGQRWGGSSSYSSWSGGSGLGASGIGGGGQPPERPTDYSQNLRSHYSSQPPAMESSTAAIGRAPSRRKQPITGSTRTRQVELASRKRMGAELQVAEQRQFLESAVQRWNQHYARRPINWMRIFAFLPEDTDPVNFLIATGAPAEKIMANLIERIKVTEEFQNTIALCANPDDQEINFRARLILFSAMNSALATLNEEFSAGVLNHDTPFRDALVDFMDWFGKSHIGRQIALKARKVYVPSMDDLVRINTSIFDSISAMPGQLSFVELSNDLWSLRYYVQHFLSQRLSIDVTAVEENEFDEHKLQLFSLLEKVTRLSSLNNTESEITQAMVFMALASIRYTPYIIEDNKLMPDETKFRSELIGRLAKMWEAANYADSAHELKQPIALFSIEVLKENILAVNSGSGSTGRVPLLAAAASSATATVTAASSIPSVNINTHGRMGEILTLNSIYKLKGQLRNLRKSEIKNLGQTLGLDYFTVENSYEDSSVQDYLEDILRAWILGRGDGCTPATPEELAKALRTEGHNGAAIKTEGIYRK